MFLELNANSDKPIYQQIRDQIVMAVALGRLKTGERLPSIRALAAQCGINVMTVNKAYALLKREGYIFIDRRHGAAVAAGAGEKQGLSEKSLTQLRLIAAEGRLAGWQEEDFLSLCAKTFRLGGKRNG